MLRVGAGSYIGAGPAELVVGTAGVGRREVLALADGRTYEECGGDFWGAAGG